MTLAARSITPEQSAHLNMWRGLAALVVVVAHAIQIYAPDIERLPSGFAIAAVMVFFVLSGFLVQKSLARHFRGGAYDWRGFARARANRILGPFVVSLGLVLVLWAVAPLVFQSGDRTFLTPTTREGFSLDGFARTALFLNNFTGETLLANGPLWSLTYEVWYYLIAGLLGAAFAGHRIGWTVIPLTLLLIVADFRFAVWGMGWCAGFGLSILHGHGILDRAPRWLSTAGATVPIIALAVLAACPDSFEGKAILLFGFSFGGWFTVHLVRVLTGGRIIQIAILRSTAPFSYSLYIIHFPLLLFCYGISEAMWVAPLAVSVVIGVAAVFGPRIEAIRLIGIPNASTSSP